MAPDFTTLYKRWSTGTPRKEDMKFICTPRTYKKDLSPEMDTILSEVESFLGFPPFIPKNIHEELTVYLDDKEERETVVSLAHLKRVLALYEKELEDLKQEGNQKNCLEIDRLSTLIAVIRELIASATGESVTITTSILGYYKRNGQDGKPEISLMMGALEGNPQLAAIVYVHELMHAYFDKHIIEHPYIPEIEEPLAEYGMLCFIDMFQRAHSEYPELRDMALKHVEGKKYSIGICHYGYGAFLFKDKSNFCVDWVTLFHSVCVALNEDSTGVKAYKKQISSIRYPRKERLCQEGLLKALHMKQFFVKANWTTKDRLFFKVNSKIGDYGYYEANYLGRNDIIIRFADEDITVSASAYKGCKYIYFQKDDGLRYFDERYPIINGDFIFYEKTSGKGERPAEWIAKKL